MTSILDGLNRFGPSRHVEIFGGANYVAVPPRFRRQGIGGRLLDDAVSHLGRQGARHVYASVEQDNLESRLLFESRGFQKVQRSEMTERYGRMRALLMYREMMVVPGELLMGKSLGA